MLKLRACLTASLRVRHLISAAPWAGNVNGLNRGASASAPTLLQKFLTMQGYHQQSCDRSLTESDLSKGGGPQVLRIRTKVSQPQSA